MKIRGLSMLTKVATDGELVSSIAEVVSNLFRRRAYTVERRRIACAFFAFPESLPDDRSFVHVPRGTPAPRPARRDAAARAARGVCSGHHALPALHSHEGKPDLPN